MTPRLARALIVCLAMATGASVSAAGRQLTVPVKNDDFAGTIAISTFAAQDGQVVARGRMSGVLQSAAGPLTVAGKVSLPVTIDQASCQLVRLEFGAQDVTLVRQTVHVDQSTVDFTPQSTAGSALCATADAGDVPDALATALNTLLAPLAK